MDSTAAFFKPCPDGTGCIFKATLLGKVKEVGSNLEVSCERVGYVPQ